MITTTENGTIALPANQIERSAQKISHEVALLGYHHEVNNEKEFFERLGRDVALRCLPPEMLRKLLSSNGKIAHSEQTD